MRLLHTEMPGGGDPMPYSVTATAGSRPETWHDGAAIEAAAAGLPSHSSGAAKGNDGQPARSTSRRTADADFIADHEHEKKSVDMTSGSAICRQSDDREMPRHFEWERASLLDFGTIKAHTLTHRDEYRDQFEAQCADQNGHPVHWETRRRRKHNKIACTAISARHGATSP